MLHKVHICKKFEVSVLAVLQFIWEMPGVNIISR